MYAAGNANSSARNPVTRQNANITGNNFMPTGTRADISAAPETPAKSLNAQTSHAAQPMGNGNAPASTTNPLVKGPVVHSPNTKNPDGSLTIEGIQQQELYNFANGNNPNGTKGAGDPTSSYYGANLKDILDGVDKGAAASNAAGNSVSIEDTNAQKQTAIAKYAADHQAMVDKQNADQARIQGHGTIQQNTTTGGAGGGSQAIAGTGAQMQQIAAQRRAQRIAGQQQPNIPQATPQGSQTSTPQGSTGGVAGGTTPSATPGGTPGATTGGTPDSSTTGGTTPSSTAGGQPDATTPTNVPTPPATTPQDAGVMAALDQAVAQNPGDSALALQLASYKQFIASQQTAAADEKTKTDIMLSGGTIDGHNVTGVDQTAANVQAKLDTMTQSQKDMSTYIKGFLDDNKAETEKDLAIQQKNEQDKNVWNTLQQTRQDSRDEVNAHNSMVARIALAGGFGQDAGMREVQASDIAYESKISDLKTQMGINATDIAAKYSGLYQTAQTAYVTATVANAKDLQTQLTALSTQGIENGKTSDAAERTILTDSWNAQVQARKDTAAATDKITTDMNATIAAKAKAVQDQTNFNTTNATKLAAITAAENNRKTQQDIAAGVHTDALTVGDRTATQTFLSSASTDLHNANNPVAVYNITSRFTDQFNSAYAQYNAKDATPGDRAAASATLAFQFSHAQNPGSLRIQEIAAQEALAGQSLSDAMLAKVEQMTFGGSDLGKDTVEAMNTIMMKGEQNQRQSAFQALLPIWNRAQNTNAGLMSPSSPRITPSEFVENGTLLQMINQQRDAEAVTHGNSGAPSPGVNPYQSSASGGTQSGPFSPSAPMSSNSDSGNVNISETPLGSYVSQNGFRVTQGFDGMYDAKQRYMKGEHGAYDIAPPKPGQTPPIPAYNAGTVVQVGTSGPYGHHIIIDEGNGITMLYGHLSSINVKQDDQIAAGQQVGIMGSTGNSDGVHLHLEAYKDGKPYDFALNQSPSSTVASNTSTYDPAANDSLMQIAMAD
jgi:murein DD-endopeptidase MepM/ murein hydrolase activator NlpD